MSVCSEMMGSSALQLYWPTKSWDLILGSTCVLVKNYSFIGVFYVKVFFCHIAILVIKKLMLLVFVHNKLNYLTNMETFKTTTKTTVKNYLLLRLIVEDNKNIKKILF